MLRFWHLQERRRLQLFSQYRHRSALRPHPHSDGVETSGYHPDAHRPGSHLELGSLRLCSSHIQDANAVQLLQDNRLVR